MSSSKPLLRDMSPPSCRLQAAAAAALVKADEAAVEKTVAAVLVSVPFAAGVLSGLGYIETLAPNCFMFAPDQTFGNFGASISGDWRNLCISKTPLYGLRDLEIVKCSVGLLYSKALFLLVTLAPQNYFETIFLHKNFHSSCFMFAKMQTPIKTPPTQYNSRSYDSG